MHRTRRLHRALRAFDACLRRSSADVPPAILDDLIYGWDNEGMSAGASLLAEVVRQARAAKGPVLECGSGLTTLVLAVVTARTGVPVLSLEHDPGWCERVERSLERLGAKHVQILCAPLRSYGSFSWYDVPLERVPSGVALLVCDGPPGDTPGGRVGALHVLESRLQPGCVILLDDANRPAERRILDEWARDFGVRFELLGVERLMGLGRLPARAGSLRPSAAQAG